MNQWLTRDVMFSICHVMVWHTLTLMSPGSKAFILYLLDSVVFVKFHLGELKVNSASMGNNDPQLHTTEVKHCKAFLYWCHFSTKIP